MFKRISVMTIMIVVLLIAAPCWSAIEVQDDGSPVGIVNSIDFVGSTTTVSASVATVTLNDIDSGTIDGAVIGGSTPAAGTFTTLTADTSLTLDGVTITTFDDVVSPWTNAGLTTTLNAAPGAVLATHATGVMSATGFAAGTADVVLENGQIIDGGTDNYIKFTENDTLSFYFDTNDVIVDTTDGGIIFKLTDGAGTVDFMLQNDADDYIQLLTTAHQPIINFVGCDGQITAADGAIDFDDENLSTSGTLGAGATTVTSLIIGDETLARAVDNIATLTSNDADMIFKVVSGNNDGDASLYLVADKDDNGPDDWIISSIGSDNDLHFTNDTTLRLTMSAAGNILTTGSVQIPDDVNLLMGSGSDWAVQYDEAVDNQLLFVTTNTAAIATTDPMFEILVGTTPTADQQVFGVAKGTQAANTALLTLDEDGDLTILGTFAQAGTSQFIQDDTTDGIVDAAQFIHSSNDGNSTDNDGVAIAFHLMNDADVAEEFASIDIVASDVSDGTEDANFVFSQYSAGLMAETLRITGANTGTTSDYVTITANTTETTVCHPVLILATATGTAEAGHGVAISFRPEDAAGSEELARIDVVQTDAANATNDTDIGFTQNVAGALTQTFLLDADLGATFNSSVASQPVLNLHNTNADENCAVLNFRKDGAGEADNDDLGIINFYGDDSTNADVVYAYILAESADITDTAEAGRLSFQLEMADTDTAFMVLAATAATSTGQVDFNGGDVDIDFNVSTLDQADTFKVDGAGNDVMITRDLAAASTSAALLQILNTNVGDSQSAVTIIQDATTATAALPAVSIQTTGDTDQSTLFINDDSSTGGTTKASVVIDSEATKVAALYIMSANDAGGTTQNIDDYALAVVPEGVGGGVSIYRNVDAATEGLLLVQEVHVDSTAAMALFTSAQDASSAADQVTIASTDVAFDKTNLFINRDTTTGATTEAAVVIDSEDPDTSALYIMSAVDAGGTTQEIDDYALCVVTEGVGGGIMAYRNVSAATEAMLTIEDDHTDATGGLVVFTTDGDDSANSPVVSIITTDGAHDTAALSITQAGTGTALTIVSGALAVDGDSITCDGVLVIDATSATSFNDENITNVGDIACDSITSDAATVVLINDGLQGLVDEISAVSGAGTAASLATVVTEITTNGDSDLDVVTLANGVSGQIKIFVIVVETAGPDTVKITPATFLAGTQITFDGTVGDGCIMVYADNEGWIVVANNGGTIA